MFGFPNFPCQAQKNVKITTQDRGKVQISKFSVAGISTFWALLPRERKKEKTFGKHRIVILLSKNGGKVDGL